MPNKRFPRSGSMQYWPRKRSKRPYARVRSWPTIEESKISGFAGYKVGMTHVILTDNRKTSTTKNQEITVPVTVIECPPLKVLSAVFYRKEGNGIVCSGEILAENLSKDIRRKIKIPKKGQKKKIEDITIYDEVRLKVHTQPSLTGIGKKKPEIFELRVGGSKEDQLGYAKENLGKEIKIDTVFREGDQIDIHAVSTGRGTQGPVKRFGIKIRAKKSEKTKRGPGSLGGWKGQGHFMYRIAHAGQTGYHLRTESNKWLLKISNDPKEVNPKGGFIRYGEVKNNFILMKGSIIGPSKRMIILSHPMRPNKGIPSEAPTVNYVSLDSKQG